MTTETLTDRYISAATRSVPEAQRGDVAAELRASIADQIDARVDLGESADAAERAVLTELGDPEALAADYTDRPLWLIGPAYYLTWRRLLKILLWIVPPIATIGVAIGTTIAGQSLPQILGATWSVLFGSVLNVCFWVTLTFALVERYSKGDQGVAVPEWTLDDLPEVRETGAKLGDVIASFVGLVAAAGFLLWDHYVGVVYRFGDGGAGWISFLADGLWPWWVGGLLAILALQAMLTLVAYAHGRWSTPLGVVNVLLNAAYAVPAIWLLYQGRLLNPGFWPSLIPDAGSAHSVGVIIAILFGFGIALTAAWDSIDKFRKARRS